MGSDTWLSFLPLALVVLIFGFIWAKARRDARNVQPVPLVPVPPPQYKGPLAFFRCHYNGDYSLARSYWVNTALVSLFAPLLGIMLVPWLSDNFPARYASGAFLIITMLGVVAWFWAISGTWASANKHVQRGGSPSWAAAAKFMIVIGVMKIFGDFGNLSPAIREHIRVASGAQLGPSTKLEVRADGRSILLSGGINDGSAEQLDKALQMAPSVTTVVLSSQGGWIREGQMLANVIRKRRLNTYVEGYCASACTIAFVAGKERAAAPSAQIGFHAPRGVGSLATKPTPEESAQLRTAYQDAGLPEAFLRRVLDTSNDTMWHPSHDELLTAGVLTRTSMGGETAALSTVVRSKEALITGFKKIDMYAVLAERAPQDFERVIEAAWVTMQNGGTDAEVTTAARAELSTIFPRFLPLASDETLIAYQKLMQEQLEVLRRKNLKACVETIFPSGQPNNLTGVLPSELANRELNLTARLLREVDPARAIKPDGKAVDRVARQATAHMTQEQLLAFSDEATRRRSSPALVCDAAIAFFAGLNAIPISERGRALRILYSAN